MWLAVMLREARRDRNGGESVTTAIMEVVRSVEALWGHVW